MSKQPYPLRHLLTCKCQMLIISQNGEYVVTTVTSTGALDILIHYRQSDRMLFKASHCSFYYEYDDSMGRIFQCPQTHQNTIHAPTSQEHSTFYLQTPPTLNLTSLKPNPASLKTMGAFPMTSKGLGAGPNYFIYRQSRCFTICYTAHPTKKWLLEAIYMFRFV